MRSQIKTVGDGTDIPINAIMAFEAHNKRTRIVYVKDGREEHAICRDTLKNLCGEFGAGILRTDRKYAVMLRHAVAINKVRDLNDDRAMRVVRLVNGHVDLTYRISRRELPAVRLRMNALAAERGGA